MLGGVSVRVHICVCSHAAKLSLLFWTQVLLGLHKHSGVPWHTAPTLAVPTLEHAKPAHSPHREAHVLSMTETPVHRRNKAVISWILKMKDSARGFYCLVLSFVVF